jgi:4'-phosphopantetheinyl transferase EntD
MPSYLHRALSVLQAKLPTATFEVQAVLGGTRCDPAEAELALEMNELRRAQFIAGRACARTALVRTGHTACSVLADSEGVPQWPVGIVGSISHKHLLSIAAIAPAANLRAIGIDLERDESSATRSRDYYRRSLILVNGGKSNNSRGRCEPSRPEHGCSLPRRLFIKPSSPIFDSL